MHSIRLMVEAKFGNRRSSQGSEKVVVNLIIMKRLEVNQINEMIGQAKI